VHGLVPPKHAWAGTAFPHSILTVLKNGSIDNVVRDGLPSYADVVFNHVQPHLFSMPGCYLDRSNCLCHCARGACRPSAMLPYDESRQAFSKFPVRDSMSHYQTIALTSPLPCRTLRRLTVWRSLPSAHGRSKPSTSTPWPDCPAWPGYCCHCMPTIFPGT
jgi:hypothetical protein